MHAIYFQNEQVFFSFSILHLATVLKVRAKELCEFLNGSILIYFLKNKTKQKYIYAQSYGIIGQDIYYRRTTTDKQLKMMYSFHFNPFYT